MNEMDDKTKDLLNHISDKTKELLNDYIGKPITKEAIESITNKIYPKITVKEVTQNKYHPDVLDVTVLIPNDIIEYTFVVDKDGNVIHETEIPDED